MIFSTVKILMINLDAQKYSTFEEQYGSTIWSILISQSSSEEKTGNIESVSHTRKKGFIIFSLFFSTILCEQATGLNGDLFNAGYMMKYPPLCLSSACKIEYLEKIYNSIRKYHRRITVTMSLQNGEKRIVQLAFCSFFSTGGN